ncbi:MAG: ABC transporter permease, partial [Methanobacteriota archaeon]
YYEDGIPVDEVARGPFESLDNATADTAAVRNVVRAEPLGWVPMLVNTSRTPLPHNATFLPLNFVRPSFNGVVGRLGVSWPAPPASGTMLVPDTFAAAGKVVGDPIVLEHATREYSPNGTLIRMEVRNLSVPIGGFYHDSFSPTGDFSLYNAYLAFSDIPTVRSQLNVSGSEFNGVIEIWLDREALLNPFDLDGSRGRLARETVLLDNALAPHGYSLGYAGSWRGIPLREIPNAIGGATFGLRIFYFVFAIPTLAIAAMLVRVGFDVGLTTRRRELAVLRARGVSIRGIRLHLLVEATILGLLATVLGVGLGFALSRAFHPEMFLGPAAALPAVEFSIAPGTAFVAALFGWLLAAGLSRTPARLAASEDLIASLKSFHPEEAAIPYKPARAFLLAGIGAAGILMLLAWGSLKDSPISPLIFLLGFSTAILAPFAPIFLTIAVGRYLTRGTSRPYRLIARLFRRTVGDLHVLVDRNLVRSSRRSSNTTMIVTFVVGFVVAISTLVGSADAFREQQIRWQVPADIVAGTGGAPPGFFNASHYDAVRAIPGVAAAARVMYASSDRSTISVFDADAYLATVPWVTAADLGGVDPAPLLADLARGDAFAANAAFQKEFGLEAGDSLRFNYVLGTTANVRLSAYVAGIPGMDFSFQPSQVPLAYVALAALPGANVSVSMPGSYLIHLQPGANETAVMEAVGTVLGPWTYVTSQRQAREAAASNPLTAAVYGYLQAQAYVAVLILVVAVGLLVYSAAAERKDEFATIIARGLDARRATRLLTTEGWVVCILGLLIGVAGGVVTAAMFLTLFATVSSIAIPIVVPWTIAIPLAAVLAGTWVAGLLGAFSIRHMDVAQVLKLRGG